MGKKKDTVQIIRGTASLKKVNASLISSRLYMTDSLFKSLGKRNCIVGIRLCFKEDNYNK